MNKYIFLDRDGVINKDYKDYVYNWERFEFLPNVLEAIKLLCDNGFNIIIITNQSGINRKVYTLPTLNLIHTNMTNEIIKHGGNIKDIFWCPHDPNEGCKCRKPLPGMLYDAADGYKINLSETYFIGDWVTDIQCGHVAGCKPVLVKTGRGERAIKELEYLDIKLHYVAVDLLDAVTYVIRN